MSNTVVWYDSAETGAPTLNNTAGSLDAVLNACLVTGFRVLTLDSVTVAANVATATVAAGHGYGPGRIVELAGAGTGAINGRKLVTVTGASTFTFAAPGVADGTISGTITAKRAPLGWARPLSSGNVSIYTRTDVTATSMALRVDDSGSGAAAATYARWRMVESYSDLSTFTGPTPPASVYGGGGQYIPKGPNSSTAKPWVLVGDGRTFYLFTDASGWPASSYNGAPNGVWAFGDIEPFRSGDAYGCILAGADDGASPNSTTLGNTVSLGTAPGSDMVMLPRPFNGIGSPVRAAAIGHRGSGRMGNGGPLYPSPVDNGLAIVSPVLLAEANSSFGNLLRGTLRGVGDPQASILMAALHLQVLDNVVGSDRRWLLVASQISGSPGHTAFDITGPW